MDFFERQEVAKRRTRWLLVYFGLAVAGIIIVLYGVGVLLARGSVFGWVARFQDLASRRPGDELEISEPQRQRWWYPQLFFWIAAGTLGVIGSGSLWKISQLSGGGSLLAINLGGRYVDPNTQDPDERRLLNVVEEMAIASGIAPPQVFVLKAEKGINAFAAGYTASNAALGVTAGALRLLTRDELQGVVAHEFSHILNGDMRLNTRMIGLVHGILIITIAGRVLLRAGKELEGRFVLLALSGGLLLVVIGFVGVVFARLVKSAISRQREFLADAAAVQFTRLPEGLVGALKKIGGLPCHARLGTLHAEEASHMFFGNALSRSWTQWMSTHPPLSERIRRWEHGFDGHFTPVPAAEWNPPEPIVLPSLHAEAEPAKGPAAMLPAAAPIRWPEIMLSLGNVTAAHLAWAVDLTRSLPTALVEAVREPGGAMGVVYALLLSSEERTRSLQWQVINQCVTLPAPEQIQVLLGHLAPLDVQARLPLISLAWPALRRLDATQYQQFMVLSRQLIEADQQIDLFEYALQKMLQRHLRPHFETVARPVAQYYVLRPLAADSQVLLSALAHVGQSQPDQRQAAFLAGTQVLDPQNQQAWKLLDFESCNLAQIDTALEHLAEAAPAMKRSLLQACGTVVAADGLIQPKEAEMLRAIADSLDCPIPPLVSDAGASCQETRVVPTKASSRL